MSGLSPKAEQERRRRALWAWLEDVMGSDLPNGPKVLAWALQDGYNVKHGRCYPMQRTLARRMGKRGRSGIIESRDKLVAAGFLRYQPRPRGDGRGRSSDEYFLIVPGDPELTTVLCPEGVPRTPAGNGPEGGHRSEGF